MLEFLKKILSYIVAGFIFILSIFGIKIGGDKPSDIPETTTSQVEITTAPETTTEFTTEPETTTEATTKPETTTEVTTVPETTTEVTTTKPFSMTKAEIVAYYKQAATKTEKNGCQSKSTMKVSEIDGGSGVLGMILGSISGAIGSSEGSTKTFDGITGAYEKLTVDDIKSATAVKNGDYITINLIPYDQISNESATADEGSVGHLVTAIGGIKEAIVSAGDDVVCPENSVTLSYKNAYAKNIKIDTRTGEIVSGAWGYNLTLTIDGVKIAGITLKGTKFVVNCSVVMPA